MKKIFLSVLILATVSMTASAQEKSNRKNDPDATHQRHNKDKKGHHKDMMKDLNLTDAQKKEVAANRSEYKSKMQALKQDQNISAKEMTEKKAALHNEQKEKMERMLTPEQKNKMAEAKQKNEAEAQQRSEKKLAQMKSKLSLSDDQYKKLKEQQESNQAQMKAIRDNQSLDAATKKQQMTALKNNAKEQRKNVLTTDQLKKMEENKNNKKAKDSKKSKK